jgi:regulator of replication initiation timing
MLMTLIRDFCFSYWYSQADYLRQRLQEIDSDEYHLQREREKLKNRLSKADAKCCEYARTT